MVKKIKKKLKKVKLKRTTVALLFFAALFFVLIQRLFSLQIIDGKNYADDFTVSTTKERTLKSTRGNIRDRNGKLLASNQLSYSIILEDNGTYDSTRQKNLTLNHVAYSILKVLEKNGESVDIAFHVILDEKGNFAYDTSDFTLDRFKADVFGYAQIDKMKKEEAEATADEMMAYLMGDKRYALVAEKTPYTKKELADFNLPESFSKQEILDIIKIRYALSANSFKKYVPATIATNVSDETVAEIMERKSTLQGIDIMEDSIRVYADSEYFAPIIGYTGRASSEELEKLQEKNSNYTTDAIIGKSGIEQYMETTLQGVDGKETINVDNLGKVLKINENSRIDPVSGKDVYLTIDKDLQIATYKILEQQIAGVLAANIVNEKEFDTTNIEDTALIRVPIYDVYHALINNNVIDIAHFKAEDASSTEKSLYKSFTAKQEAVFDEIRSELTASVPKAYKDLPKEMQEYLSYIVDQFLMKKTGILSSDAIDATDPVYLAWTKDSSISLKEYLTYAASQNWIDISKFYADGDYLDSSEVYDSLGQYLSESLKDDTGFSKIIYKYLLLTDVISGAELCTVLYDQGILSTNDGMYENLVSGKTNAFDFMIEKIKKLEITPAQLALNPCSGSAVITDATNGDVLACVTYPGYDNNRLANHMDTAYYNKLAQDLSQPFYNKATQQKTAPGSTFKPITAIAGLGEGIAGNGYGVVCNGVFDLVDKPINCWNKDGHGYQELQQAITNSCNVFFNQVTYDMGLDKNHKFSDSLALSKLEKYAKMFSLDKKSGIELPEAEPEISDKYALQSSIGQGTHNFTTSQLARYVTTIANRGTSYKLTLLDKTTDSDGNIIKEYEPEVESTVDIPKSDWDIIHAGMQGVISNNEAFQDLSIPMCGKTGTAQLNYQTPSHGLFVGFAPADSPKIALAVRIAHGYSSSNAAVVAKEIVRYQFDLADKNQVLTGTAASISSTQRTD